MLLLAMSASEDLMEFVGERWRVHYGEKNAPNPRTEEFKRVYDTIWKAGWRPITSSYSLAGCPASVIELIVRCFSHESVRRPSFQEILSELSTTVASELENLANSEEVDSASPADAEAFGGEYPADMGRASNRISSSFSTRRQTLEDDQSGVVAVRENPMLATKAGRSFTVTSNDLTSV